MTEIITGIIALIFLIILIWLFYTRFFGAEYQPVSNKVAEKMIELAALKKKDNVCDLGCGNGKLLLKAAPFCNRAVGVEIDPLRAWIARFKTGKIKNIKILKGNMFNYDLRDINVVFIFLKQKTNDKLLAKFKRELKKGSRIVSYCWTLGMPVWKQDQKSRVFAYKI